MKASIVISAVALALGAAPILAERPEPREGGGGVPSGGGASSGAVARHPSSGGSSGSSSDSSYSGPSRSGNSSSDLTDAQRRHPRPGTGSGHRGRVIYRSSPYYPGYYGGYYGRYYGGYGYYDPWWWGYGYGYGSYPGYAYRFRDHDNTGSLRLQVDPNKARVYVDGYYAGIVDDYDGLFQRLRLPYGRHEIAFKLEGYRTHRVRLFVPPDQTLKIKYDLVPGEGEESIDDSLDRPGLDWAEQERQRDRDRRDRYGSRERDRYDRQRPRDERYDRETRDEQDEDARGADRPVPGSALLSLDVRPEQAAVYVDGAFRGTGRDVRDLNLPPGRHHVEIVAPGFRTFDREVELRAGETETLRVELERS